MSHEWTWLCSPYSSRKLAVASWSYSCFSKGRGRPESNTVIFHSNPPIYFQLDSGPSCYDRSLAMSWRAMRCYLALCARDKTLSLTAGHSNGRSIDHVFSGWWFGTWILFFHILGKIIPTDFHIFQRGRYTTNQFLVSAGELWHRFHPITAVICRGSGAAYAPSIASIPPKEEIAGAGMHRCCRCTMVRYPIFQELQRTPPKKPGVEPCFFGYFPVEGWLLICHFGFVVLGCRSRYGGEFQTGTYGGFQSMGTPKSSIYIKSK